MKADNSMYAIVQVEKKSSISSGVIIPESGCCIPPKAALAGVESPSKIFSSHDWQFGEDRLYMQDRELVHFKCSRCNVDGFVTLEFFRA